LISLKPDILKEAESISVSGLLRLQFKKLVVEEGGGPEVGYLLDDLASFGIEYVHLFELGEHWSAV
jgi:hypothetical protein